MQRYIELLFDDSGSMTGKHASGLPKHEVAKQLFIQSVLPSIGERGDEVVLRLLRDTGCQSVRNGSNAKQIGPSRLNIEKAIKGISSFHKSTPLYLTVKDSIEECARLKHNGADYNDYMIFVLTDGGDTCSYDIRDIISEQQLKEWKVVIPKLEPVLVQFDVQSSISRNNLSGAFKFLGGRSVNVGDSSAKSVSLIRKAIQSAGFEGSIIPHCIDSNPKSMLLTWPDLEKEGIHFHQAHLMYQHKLIDFKPEHSQSIDHDQYHELKFLHGLTFISQIPMTLVRSMIAQLQRPLLYTHECIRWDFSKAKWVEIQKVEFYSFKEDENVKFADRETEMQSVEGRERLLDRDMERMPYYLNNEYEVVQISDDTFTLRKYWGDRISEKPNRAKVLRPGNKVKFRY